MEYLIWAQSFCSDLDLKLMGLMGNYVDIVLGMIVCFVNVSVIIFLLLSIASLSCSRP